MMKNILILIFLNFSFLIAAAGNLEESYNNRITKQTISNYNFSLKDELLDYCKDKSITTIKINEEIILPAYTEYITEELSFDLSGNLLTKVYNKKNLHKESNYLFSYKYDDVGNLVYESTKFTFYKYNDTKLVEKTINNQQRIIEYNSENQVLRIKKPLSNELIEFHYDEQNNLIQDIHTDQNGDQTSRYYMYRPSGKLDAVIIEYKINDEKSLLKNVYEYPSAREIIIKQFNDESEVLYTNEMEYDLDGNMIRKLQYSSGKLAYLYKYEYDSNGNQTFYESKYCGENWGSHWFGREIWEYDSLNRVIVHYQYNDDMNPDTNDFTLYSRTTYVYSENQYWVTREDMISNNIKYSKHAIMKNDLLSQVQESYYSSGKLSSVKTTDYEYDDNIITASTVDDGLLVKKVELSYEYIQ